jgi:hypothetical protein
MVNMLKLSADELSKINSIYKEQQLEDEFEMMFLNNNKKNKIGLSEYLNLLTYISFISKKKNLQLEKKNTLDVIYTHNKETFENYRIEINSIDKINKISESICHKKNHVIFSLLATKYYNEQDENVFMMKKNRDMKKTFDIVDYSLRVRVSSETKITNKEYKLISKLNEMARFNINFRFKERISLIVYDTADVQIKIDLTMTRTSSFIEKVQTAVPMYELEVELIKKTNNFDNKCIDHMYDEISKLIMVIQQSSHIMSVSEQQIIIDKYNTLINKDNKYNLKSMALNARQTVSLEIQHATDKLPNKYTVTDKADGERYFMLIDNGKVYLISNNLNVKYTGIDGKDKYNDTVMDGELIYLVIQAIARPEKLKPIASAPKTIAK